MEEAAAAGDLRSEGRRCNQLSASIVVAARAGVEVIACNVVHCMHQLMHNRMYQPVVADISRLTHA